MDTLTEVLCWMIFAAAYEAYHACRDPRVFTMEFARCFHRFDDQVFLANVPVKSWSEL